MQSCNIPIEVFVSLGNSISLFLLFSPLFSSPVLFLSSLLPTLLPLSHLFCSTQEEARRHSINVLQTLKRHSDGWSGLGVSVDPVTTRLKEGRKNAQRKQEDIEVRQIWYSFIHVMLLAQ